MRTIKTMMWVGIAVVAILFCIVLANMRFINPPRLVIKVDGKPASNRTLILPVGSERPYQLDADGSVTTQALDSRGPILIPKPDGGGVSVHFPQHGTKVIDFQSRMKTTTIVQFFGLVSERHESFNLTDEEMADIESGRRSSAEIVEEIRRTN
jgi:hypothetical protein